MKKVPFDQLVRIPNIRVKGYGRLIQVGVLGVNWPEKRVIAREVFEYINLYR
jgi:hypothetical protein